MCQSAGGHVEGRIAGSVCRKCFGEFDYKENQSNGTAAGGGLGGQRGSLVSLCGRP